MQDGVKGGDMPGGKERAKATKHRQPTMGGFDWWHLQLTSSADLKCLLFLHDPWRNLYLHIIKEIVVAVNRFALPQKTIKKSNS